ncbi:hypothetical protein F5888DRAFT_1629943 [Russula emetica]|nr:hypothetical protein F5888DRAFT_1629943 [Russula emetica]
MTRLDRALPRATRFVLSLESDFVPTIPFHPTGTKAYPPVHPDLKLTSRSSHWQACPTSSEHSVKLPICDDLTDAKDNDVFAPSTAVHSKSPSVIYDKGPRTAPLTNPLSGLLTHTPERKREHARFPSEGVFNLSVYVHSSFFPPSDASGELKAKADSDRFLIPSGSSPVSAISPTPSVPSPQMWPPMPLDSTKSCHPYTERSFGNEARQSFEGHRRQLRQSIGSEVLQESDHEDDRASRSEQLLPDGSPEREDSVSLLSLPSSYLHLNRVLGHHYMALAMTV